VTKTILSQQFSKSLDVLSESVFEAQ